MLIYCYIAVFSDLDPDPFVFTLEGQIQHKLCFIDEQLPTDVEIVLIGHSIGAYIVLEMMDRLDDERVIQGNY